MTPTTRLSITSDCRAGRTPWIQEPSSGEMVAGQIGRHGVPEVKTEPTTFWTAPDGSSLLTFDVLSVQTAPHRGSRIVWIIVGTALRQRSDGKAGAWRSGSTRGSRSCGLEWRQTASA